MTFGLCFGGDTEIRSKTSETTRSFFGGQRQKNRSKKGRLAVVRLLHALGLCFGGDRNYQSKTSESTRFFFSGVQARIAEQMCRRAYNAYRAYSLQNRYPTKQAQHNGGRVSRAKMIKCAADQAGQVMQIKCT